MTLRDIPAGSIVQMYDLFRTVCPRRTEQLRMRVRTDCPGLPEVAARKRVVDLLLRNDPRLYRFVRRHLLVQRPEPRSCSPFEQIKARTGILYPTGEITGGNYGSGF